MDRPLRVREVVWPNGIKVFATDGTPADCVSLASLGFLPKMPDLVISGINTGPNLGDDVTYSGTVAAAMEAYIAGFPAIAISINAYVNWLFETPAQFAAELVMRFQVDPNNPDSLTLPKGTFWNVNVPNLPYAEIVGVEVTKQGRRIYQDKLWQREDPYGRPYYWIGGERPIGHHIEDTDFVALSSNKISITPMMLDLTDYAMLEQMRGWKWR
jgi:5'-nucleotidase